MTEHATMLRMALPADAGAIETIEQLAFDDPSERLSRLKIERLIRSPRCVVLVVEIGGRVLAWAAGIRDPRRQLGRIYAVAVHPDGRGRKLGPMLLQKLIDRFVQERFTRVVLEVRSENAGAIRLYQRFGFQDCAELPDFYAPGRHARRMLLTIQSPVADRASAPERP